ncbi:peptidoglycan-recognition protein LB-like isoform X1 [Cydia amplana]|uniref:peptidoglycan-recognition protein LB-like isoform X1 n=1 Tax=Cydia amplana TaxID=1869771 RepID=UPI002FE53BFE
MAGRGYIVIFACLAASVLSLPANQKSDSIRKFQGYRLRFPYYSREDWGAKPAISVVRLSLPVPYVTIHHTYIPAACFTAEQCKSAMRSIQTYHQDDQGWNDIGYNFAIGSDGAVYEGRGWSAVGAHAVGVNSQSIGIVFIGDYVSDLPPPKSLQAAKDLIAIGVKAGFISPSYHLIAHRQVSATECPGQSLYTEITSWDRFLPDFDVNT